MKYNRVIKKLLLDIISDTIFFHLGVLVALLTNICKNDALISNILAIMNELVIIYILNYKKLNIITNRIIISN